METPNANITHEHHDREILDANLGRTNIVEFEKYHEIAMETLDFIIDKIKPICGPNAMHNLVIYQQMSGSFDSNVFSNDGIHMLRSMDFVNPIQRYIVNYVKYVADKVEAASSDGTSTAIYFTACMMKHALDANVRHRRNEGMMPAVTKATYDETKKLEQMFKDILNNLEQYKITLSEETPEVRQELIYQLALSTSKGQEMLSKYMITLFENLPETLYSLSNYLEEQVETEEPFTIEVKDHDAILSVIPDTTAVYNDNLFTTIDRPDSCVLVLPQYLQKVGILLDFIDWYEDELCYKDKHLFIVYQGINTSDLIEVQKRIDSTKITIASFVVYSQVLVNNPIELMVLLAMADKEYTFNEMEGDTLEKFQGQVIENVHVKIENKELLIYGMFETEEGKYMHPLYVSKTNSFFNSLEKTMADRIDHLKTVHNAGNSRHELKEFMRIYRNMICSKLPLLKIGGNTTTHLANVNVVDDVIGVVSVAMKHGVVFDLLPKLYAAVEQCPDDRVTAKFMEDIVNFIDLTYTVDYTAVVKMVGMGTISDWKYVFFNDLIKVWVAPNKSNLKQKDNGRHNIEFVTVVQSYKSIEETLKRLIETIPKMASINSIMAQNSVMKGD